MKTRTWMIFFAVLLLVCGGLSLYMLMPKEAASFAQISSHGEIVKTVSLHLDQQLTVETEDGFNTVTVKNGKIAVTQASCPDHYCMKRGFCNSGTEIVCLPNRLVIKFLGQQEIDMVVG